MQNIDQLEATAADRSGAERDRARVQPAPRVRVRRAAPPRTRRSDEATGEGGQPGGGGQRFAWPRTAWQTGVWWRHGRR
jgi:hypothetical protein